MGEEGLEWWYFFYVLEEPGGVWGNGRGDILL